MFPVVALVSNVISVLSIFVVPVFVDVRNVSLSFAPLERSNVYFWSSMFSTRSLFFFDTEPAVVTVAVPTSVVFV